MQIAPDTLLDQLFVLASRVATVSARRRHREILDLGATSLCEKLIPPELRPPRPIDDSENGYRLAVEAASALHPAGAMQANLLFRAEALMRSKCKVECATAKAALASYSKSLEIILRSLEMPKWQVPAPSKDVALPELENLRRLGSALLLKSAMHACQGDQEEGVAYLEAAVQLSRKLRTCQGFLIHYVVGLALDADVQRLIFKMLQAPGFGPVAAGPIRKVLQEDRTAELKETYRWEYARVCIPNAISSRGPWDEIPSGAPASYSLPLYAAQWTLQDHPQPYDPAEMVCELVLIAEAFQAWVDEGWSAAPAMEEMRRQYMSDWPEAMTQVPVGKFRVKLGELQAARERLRSTPNPQGMLQCARAIHASSEVFRAAALGRLRLAELCVLEAAQKLGRSPLCLEELVGNRCLDKLPIDPFTDEPIAYHEQDRALWSPGPKHRTYEEIHRCFAAKNNSPYWVKLN
jgi:hypothetical protein